MSHSQRQSINLLSRVRSTPQGGSSRAQRTFQADPWANQPEPAAEPSPERLASLDRTLVGHEAIFSLEYGIQADLSHIATLNEELKIPGPHDGASALTWRLLLHGEREEDEGVAFKRQNARYVTLKKDETTRWPPGVHIAAQVYDGRKTRSHQLLEHAPSSENEVHCFSLRYPPAHKTTFVIVYRISGDLALLGLEKTGMKHETTSQVLAARTSGVPLQKHPHDLRLFFPQVGKDGAELWTSSVLLSSVSPYFKDLLSSDFAEAVTRHGKRPRTEVSTVSSSSAAPASSASSAAAGPSTTSASAAGSTRTRPTRDFDDSDDEADDFLTSSSSYRLSVDTSDSDLSYREVRITEACFSTYHALLVWLTTGHINFAPLRSSLTTAASKDVLRLSRQKAITSSSSLPLPVSAKSVYRLAHFLSLPALQSAARSSFSSQLSPSNIASELFGDACLAHDGLREEALKAAVRKWSEVKESKAMKEVEAKVLSGEWGMRRRC